MKNVTIVFIMLLFTTAIYGQSSSSSPCLEIFVRVKNADFNTVNTFACATDIDIQWGPDFNLNNDYSYREITLTGNGGGCSYGWDINLDCDILDPYKLGRNVYRLYNITPGSVASIYIDIRLDGGLANGDIHLAYDSDLDRFELISGDCAGYSGTVLSNNTVLTLTTGGYNKFQPTNPSNLYISNSTGNPILEWTESVPSVSKYNVYRNNSKITPTPISSTTFVDYDFWLGTNMQQSYKVQAVSGDGSKISPGFSNVININAAPMNNKIGLVQIGELLNAKNYPNPFNPNTKIQYELSEESYVILRVFDIVGRQVCELSNEFQTS